ncbi:hypothetical protein DERP_009143 [Dermatophagoides pteronyssinus]|uniref:Uncharacterized protein n=1 Tax=Dermatophagoides pteronyssinus TaxID=6956 RepID=A0ABQ8JQP4_DERPT|nr:hypothetical protein DERP_009143 [Dermatophagoides pteronyssinus]
MCQCNGSSIIGDPSGVHRTRNAVADTVRTVTLEGGPCGNACNVWKGGEGADGLRAGPTTFTGIRRSRYSVYGRRL